ncbi:sensor domain-containing diguanylate cyclase [Paenibacillus sp. LS1]|uniref:sensor domain-containing diguanylate cyclase n=1 Tax=Paenibacillus sp. LS1 TaxID=2992120 RepID=UPI002232C1F0|nr:sensor domain-containing diguanylate cyclase [Paenibacillus sp. LS1]MCW3795669.1 sensor domain-containing diguanylate cyclase [Paenibacillus sp. LS1]
MILQNTISRLRSKVRNSKKISFTVLLGGLVTLSVVMTLTIMVISSYTSQKESLINSTLTQNNSKSIEMSLALDSLFFSMQEALKYVATQVETLDYSDTERLNSTLDLVRNSSNFFNSVALADETGLVLSTSPYYPLAIGRHVSSEAAKAAIKSQAPYISEAYPAPKTNERIVFIGEPLLDSKGSFIGMIGGTIHLQESNILNLSFGSQIKNSVGSYFFIVDQNGTLLFHPSTERIGEDVSKDEVVQKLLTNSVGKDRFKNLAGVDSLAGYHNVPSTDWGVVVVTPTQVVYDQLNHHIWMLLLYTSIPFIILTLIVLRIARKLANPFVILAEMVNQMDQGKVELPVVQSHWNREADMITRTVLGVMKNFRNKTDQLVYDSRTDLLTGMKNRRFFEEAIQEWIQEEIIFCIVVFDIDRFKSINDSFGHQAGDEVLKEVSKIIQSSVRDEDISSRFGGEEFVVLLKQYESNFAFDVAEKIRRLVEESVMPINHSVTISAGIAEYPLHSESGEELFHLADSALYQAKEEGRNRTIIIQKMDSIN